MIQLYVFHVLLPIHYLMEHVKHAQVIVLHVRLVFAQLVCRNTLYLMELALHVLINAVIVPLLQFVLHVWQASMSAVLEDVLLALMDALNALAWKPVQHMKVE